MRNQPKTGEAIRRLLAAALLLATAIGTPRSRAGEPDPSTYWRVEDVRPGMKGVGKTVMVGTTLEEFGAEVLGVMRNVSPGRDMILCRLSGCDLDHAGIVQGMSGSPIYVDGKLLGAVAFAWEFAKDPIAGVTPFSQMVRYTRFSDRRLAAERQDGAIRRSTPASGWSWSLESRDADGPIAVGAAGLGGMEPIATPIAAGGFGATGMAVLADRLGPLGMAPVSGGGALQEIIEREGDKPLRPGSPLSVAMVVGDFDLSGIGTVTHVEGDRVYGFGHPMLGLGACELPMMSGYIHTVYPRASVSMKMGSPLKVIGVLDTDVSTGIAGRLGEVPDLVPMTVKVRTGTFSEPSTYRVEVIREPRLMPGLIASVLSNALDTEGKLPEEFSTRLDATIRLDGHEPIRVADHLSGPRYVGPLGLSNLFGAVTGAVRVLVQNPVAPVRIEAIEIELTISDAEEFAVVESVRLRDDRVEPGEALRALVVLCPPKGDRRTVAVDLPIPEDLPAGKYEAVVCDRNASLNRRLRSDPTLKDPRDLDGVLRTIRTQTGVRHDRIYLHLALPDRGLAVAGRALPDLPGSVRALFDDPRLAGAEEFRSEEIAEDDADVSIDGTATVAFRVVDPAAPESGG